MLIIYHIIGNGCNRTLIKRNDSRTLLMLIATGSSLLSRVSRGSARKESADGEVKALQTLNVYSGDYGICLGQRFIEEKTNEIPTAQEVLRLMDLKDTIVTADAMNCQKDTAAAVINAGGDYVLALKGNQQLFYEEVKGYFDTDILAGLCGEAGHYRKTVDKEHGGTAVREYYITEDIQWFSEIKKWKKLKSIGMVHKVLKKNEREPGRGIQVLYLQHRC